MIYEKMNRGEDFKGTLHTSNLEQFKAMASKMKYILKHEPTEYEEWTNVELTKQTLKRVK